MVFLLGAQINFGKITAVHLQCIPEMDEVVEEGRGGEGVRREAGESWRDCLLPQECLRVGWHVREVVGDHKYLDHCPVGIEQCLGEQVHG